MANGEHTYVAQDGMKVVSSTEIKDEPDLQ